jgi:acyl-CoA reductase-like NAD-dependent aldehyde dehydrogenase
VPDTPAAEFDAAVASAHAAFPDWAATSILGRQAIMLKCVCMPRLLPPRLTLLATGCRP